MTSTSSTKQAANTPMLTPCQGEPKNVQTNVTVTKLEGTYLTFHVRDVSTAKDFMSSGQGLKMTLMMLCHWQ